MVDAAYNKEQANMETIKNLQEEVATLTQLAEQQSMASANQDQRWVRPITCKTACKCYCVCIVFIT